MEFLFNLLISAVSYMIVPFILFGLDKTDCNDKTKKIILIINSIGIKIIWIILEVIMYGEYQELNFGPPVLYYFINNIIWHKKQNIIKSENKKEQKLTKNNIPKKKKTKNFTLIYVIIICITVILCVGIFCYFNYQKEEIKQQEENERLEKEQKAAQDMQNKLNACIAQAKNSRTSLWNSNCTKQPNGSCTINSGSETIKWIEQRYQQDLNNCYQLYGN